MMGWEGESKKQVIAVITVSTYVYDNEDSCSNSNGSNAFARYTPRPWHRRALIVEKNAQGLLSRRWNRASQNDERVAWLFRNRPFSLVGLNHSGSFNLSRLHVYT